MYVLVCDDDPAVGGFMQTRFMIEGWHVELAVTGEECLSMVEHGATPDVLVLDQEMPGLKGLQVARRLRTAGYTNPLVLCSAYLSPQINRERKRLDFTPINKIDMEAVVQLITRFAEEARLARRGLTLAKRPVRASGADAPA